ncbi:unnamed protein product [Tilletia laevis]|uniref:Uncharacterized protein n=2 Tax=Tilletia TaxID=13289 RepID=A0A177UY05_9BASI|nr:hypothetical protein CF336_g6774 [Tilletia laevis]KAE8251763.1 hypothetical protein A4X03_0g6322 [Tilletia caries]CAD6941857.1 unnamed protein product [Tilletia controversa]KAE8191697.1 hypothetical protein CF335_g6018 [Tilletia laevis]CAD6891803.1 unnamed protein product [Tilletia caries]
MSSNYSTPVSSRTARDANRIRPSGSASSLLYFGPGMSSGLLRPHQKRQRRAAANNNITPAAAAIPDSVSASSAPAFALSSAPAPALALAPTPTANVTPARLAMAAPAPTPTPAPTPSRTASMMLDILKDGPQLPTPVLSRHASHLRLAELGKESAGTKRSSTTAQGAVSSPAQNARRAAMRKELEERERVKKDLKRKDFDGEGDAEKETEVGGATAKKGTTTVEQPPAKKRLTVLDIIERTAGSGGGLPARPNRSLNTPSKTLPSASFSSPGAVTSNTTLTSTSTTTAMTNTAKTVTAASKASLLPAQSNSNNNGRSLLDRLGGFAPAEQTSLPPAPSSSRQEPRFVPQQQQQQQQQQQPFKLTTAPVPTPAAPVPSPAAAAAAPTFDLGLDAVVQTILLQAGRAGAESGHDGTAARASALRVEQARLPSFTFSL